MCISRCFIQRYAKKLETVNTASVNLTILLDGPANLTSLCIDVHLNLPSRIK